MSFRSRSRTTQPVVRHRSLSSSRVPTTSTSSNSYLNNPSTYTSNRPLTVAYSVTPNNYNYYDSNENLYSPTKRSTFFSGGSSANTSPYANRKDSYSSSYKSPYADRFVSPYSSYDNGVTTAGLSLSGYSTGKSYKTNSSFNKPSSNNYTNLSKNYPNSSTSYKRDYTPAPRNLNFLSSKRFSSSNNSLNSYTPIVTPSTAIGRSQSFKSDDRSTKRDKSVSKINRSCSISSDKSEGYEVRFLDYFLYYKYMTRSIHGFKFE